MEHLGDQYTTNLCCCSFFFSGGKHFLSVPVISSSLMTLCALGTLHGVPCIKNIETKSLSYILQIHT